MSKKHKKAKTEKSPAELFAEFDALFEPLPTSPAELFAEFDAQFEELPEPPAVDDEPESESGKSGFQILHERQNDAERIAAREAARKRELRHRRSVVAGYKSAMSKTPEKRSADARKAGQASAAKRKALREANGEIVDGRPVRLQPSAKELSDYFEEFDRLHPDETFTYEERRRGALILMRKRIAELHLNRAGGDS